MALPFLKSESEENATQAMAFIAIVIITIGLTLMNVTGALAGSQGTGPLQLIVRGALAIILSGAELLAAVVLVRVMLAPNRLRKIVGSALFIGLAWACIQNGKRAVHLVFPEFETSAALLEARAGIEGDRADQVSRAQTAAIAATPRELTRVRTALADLRAEQALMASTAPDNVRQAQGLLIAQGKYFGIADGVRGPLTESAMRARGEEISAEVTRLRLQEEALVAGTVAVAASTGATTSPAERAAALADQARRARAAGLWVEIMLWVFEGARSFGLWALVTTITSRPGRPAGMTDEEWESYQEFQRRSDASKQGHETRKRKARRSGKLVTGKKHLDNFPRALRHARTQKQMTANGITMGVFRLDQYDARELFERWIKAGEIKREEAEEILNKEAGKLSSGAVPPDPRSAQANNSAHLPPAIMKGDADADDANDDRPDQAV